MANNRLYIVDTETGDRFLLAKGFGGWERPAMHQPTAVFDWLLAHDADAACSLGGPSKLRLMTESEVDAMDKAALPKQPHHSVIEPLPDSR
jgi:hypothetical protein